MGLCKLGKMSINFQCTYSSTWSQVSGSMFCQFLLHRILFHFISVVIFWPSPGRSLFLLRHIFFISVVIFWPSPDRSLFLLHRILFHFCDYFLTFSRQVFISVTSYFVSFLWLFFDLLQTGLYFCYIVFFLFLWLFFYLLQAGLYLTLTCILLTWRIWWASNNASRSQMGFNPLNAELNPICNLLALLGAHHIFHVRGLRVNSAFKGSQAFWCYLFPWKRVTSICWEMAENWMLA